MMDDVIKKLIEDGKSQSDTRLADALQVAIEYLERIEQYYSDNNMLRQPQVIMRQYAMQARHQIKTIAEGKGDE
jgi:hypothetical protein